MPGILSLAVPGNFSHLARRTVRLPLLPTSPRTICTASPRPRCSQHRFLCTPPIIVPRTTVSLDTDQHAHHEVFPISRRYQSSSATRQEEGPTLHEQESAWDETNESEYFEAQKREDRILHNRRARKALRSSRPAAVLEQLGELGHDIYFLNPDGKVDLSYASPRRSIRHRQPPRDPKLAPQSLRALHRPEPVSLYTILSRTIRHQLDDSSDAIEYRREELDLLRRQGYTTAHVQEWATSLETLNSNTAARIFEPTHTTPPLFLLNLFLRRKTIRASGLGAALRHVDQRGQAHGIEWTSLKLVATRLLRHARRVWPESIPWIASIVTKYAPQFPGNKPASVSPLLIDTTHYCNTLLSLLSLPTSQHPILYAAQQEKAQFTVLHYMAGCSPAIVVSRSGFRALTRTQLARSKTPREREWAELKGPSWPPWKEDRTAMDEDKDYDYATSRASQILHRMYEAGHNPNSWDNVAQLYAGWDTDLSPTIQTRTSLPAFSSQYGDENVGDKRFLRSMLWAGRIRTTRTRREAWAAFLSHEATGGIAHEHIYLAMFEKLYYREGTRSTRSSFGSDSEEGFGAEQSHLLPGDMKEVLPDPESPLHDVFLSEPVPSYPELFHRMCTKRVHPSGRLLSFILETCPTFGLGMRALTMARHDYDGAVETLLSGQHDESSSIAGLPGHLFTGFVRFCCRFGYYTGSGATAPKFVDPAEHVKNFQADTSYLFEYANAILLKYRPLQRTAWIALASKLVQTSRSHLAGDATRYKMISNIVDILDEVDLDPDDELFHLLCTATSYAVHSQPSDPSEAELRAYVLQTGATRLRTIFNTLVCAFPGILDSPSSSASPELGIPPHIPGPADLHAYVRALKALGDYEGLYSFSVWLVKYSADVTARARLQRTGSKLLFRIVVAIRAAVDGDEKGQGAPPEIAQLIRTQMESVEEWGGWPDQEYVDMYKKGLLQIALPEVGGR